MVQPVTAPRTSSHPIYPRPVSPLHYEPLYNRPEDLLWEQDSESDGTEDVRAAKRRRIEKLGEAYLRGDGLFILSAGIRGPLQEGWKNPWIKKKSRRWRSARLGDTDEAAPQRTVTEVPKTVERVSEGLVKKEKTKNERRDGHAEEQPSVQAHNKVEVATGPPVQDDPFAKASERPNRDTTGRSGRNKWLKKNDASLTLSRDIYTEDSRAPQLPPSRRIRPLRPAPSTSSSSDEDLAFETGPSVAVSSHGRAETAIKIQRRYQATNVSPLSLQKREVAKAEKREYPEGTLSEAGDASLKEHRQPPLRRVAEHASENEAAQQTRIDSPGDVEQRLPSPPVEGSQAEEGNLSGQRGLQPEKPTSDGPQVKDQLGTRLSPLSQSSNIQCCDNIIQECEKQVSSNLQAHQSLPPPTLSTKTSSTTVTGTMPCAQVAPTAQAPPPNESLPATGDKLSEQHHGHSHHGEENTSPPSTQAAIAVANMQLQDGLNTPQAPDAAASKSSIVDAPTSASKPKFKSKPSSDITPFSAFNKPSDRSSMQDSLNTQEILEAVTPLDITSTAKKVPLTHPTDSGPPTTNITAKKAVDQKPRKGRKRASFAPDAASTGSNSGSSQGSIKASLKVQKHITDGPLYAKGAKDILPDYSEPSGFGKLGLNMETSDEDEERPPGKESQPTERSSVALVAKPASTSSTWKTSAPQQDAQNRTPRPPPVLKRRILHQGDGNRPNRARKRDVNGSADVSGGDLEEAESRGDQDADAEVNPDFDLSAAMDEVGSFLQSWDTEKEIREIRKESEAMTRTTVKGGSVEARQRELKLASKQE